MPRLGPREAFRPEPVDLAKSSAPEVVHRARTAPAVAIGPADLEGAIGRSRVRLSVDVVEYVGWRAVCRSCGGSFVVYTVRGEPPEVIAGLRPCVVCGLEDPGVLAEVRVLRTIRERGPLPRLELLRVLSGNVPKTPRAGEDAVSALAWWRRTVLVAVRGLIETGFLEALDED